MRDAAPLKQISLPLAILDAAAGDVEIILVNFAPNERPLFGKSCNACATRPHKRIYNRVCLATTNQMTHKRYRLFCWVMLIASGIAKNRRDARTLPA